MDAVAIIVIVIVALVAIAVGAVVGFGYAKKDRSRELKQRFGPEYDRTVRTKGRREAEVELGQREARVESLQIRALGAEERRVFLNQWEAVQIEFVDQPESAIGKADSLVQEVMQSRGYPVGDFEQRSADISVDHPEVVDSYRQAHSIAVAHEREAVSTEQLRQAMLHYRTLFDELLGEVAARRNS